MDGGGTVGWWPGQCSVKLTFSYFSLRGRKGAMTNDDNGSGGGEVRLLFTFYRKCYKG